jgi:hypothetical protein
MDSNLNYREFDIATYMFLQLLDMYQTYYLQGGMYTCPAPAKRIFFSMQS